MLVIPPSPLLLLPPLNAISLCVRSSFVCWAGLGCAVLKYQTRLKSKMLNEIEFQIYIHEKEVYKSTETTGKLT